MSIYTSLFKYAPSANRSPLENFLTEALADLMRRINKSDAVEFITDTFLAASTSKATVEAFESRLSRCRKLTWKTQQTIPLKDANTYKYLDVLITADDRPVLIVEVKLGAGFTSRDESDRETSNAIHQLEDYGRWLYKNNPDAALVLLTQWSTPPTDFLYDHKKYGVELRAVCYWSQVYRWPRKYAERSMVSSTAQILATEFLAFLEEEACMADWDHNDLALLTLLWNRNPLAKLGQTLASINTRSDVRSVVGDRPLTLSAPGGQAVNFAYYYFRPGSSKWWVGWGLCIPPAPYSLMRSPRIGNSLQAFVVLASDRAENLPKPVANELELTQWIHSESETYFKVENPERFVNSPTGFADGFAEWLLPLIREAEEMLGRAHGQIPPSHVP